MTGIETRKQIGKVWCQIEKDMVICSDGSFLIQFPKDNDSLATSKLVVASRYNQPMECERVTGKIPLVAEDVVHYKCKRQVR